MQLLKPPSLLNSLQCPSPEAAATICTVWVSSMTDMRQTSTRQKNVTFIWIFMFSFFLTRNADKRRNVLTDTIVPINSFVFCLFSSWISRYSMRYLTQRTRDMGQRTAVDWTPNGAYFQFIYEMPEIVSTETEMLLLAHRTRRRHEHVSVPIFVRLFRLLFSLLLLRKFENISCIGSSNCPTSQTARQPVHPFIQLSINPSIYPSIHPSIHPFNGF